ncbi:MAG: glycerol-3-phosphate dehydrogenase [Rhodospirillales bacterium]|nr:glycerol-3-phosphate dehydrogenase [Rhodospirillales bacterium]
MSAKGSGPRTVDLLVIGGGINGAGIARDAAGRGVRVLLCEQDDLAAHTSSASTKLIHGGLRYLEHRDFRLVRDSLRERAVLLRNAPHIIWPLRFVLPHHAGLRPWWTIRLGLFLYDHLGERGPLPPCASIDLRRHASGRALQGRYRRAFEYSDCWVQDSRLVVLNARDAHARGAEVRTRTACVSLAPSGSGWAAVLADRASGERVTVAARGVVNASGPWVGRIRALAGGAEAKHRVRLVKGSHIVVRRLFDHDHPYIFQAGDGRVLFAIPYEEDYTLLGTTDVEFEGAPGRVEIAPEEVDYICAAANAYFATPVTPGDAVWTYAGIRPLIDDHAENASEVTRDYVLHLDPAPAPMLSVYGGKLTTYRRLAEQAVDMLAGPLGIGGTGWTAHAPLPGGDIPGADIGAFTAQCGARYSWLPERLLRHYVRHYGTEIHALLAGRSSTGDLREHFGAGLYAAEVAYLVEHEWARTAEDILWRRTRKGLGVSAGGADRLRAYLRAGCGQR